MYRRLGLAMLVPLMTVVAPETVPASEGDGVDLFESEAMVITGSRRPEAKRESPVTIDVISEEDIRNSGALNLWDLLRFRAGIDIVEGRSSDGNRALVSIRGFPEEYVGALQVLVDNRSAYSAMSAGVYWATLPVQMQDIERIEIVRGPNAALFGSNAGLGVINIITKKATQRLAASGEAAGGNRGDWFARSACESTGEKAGYRVSYTRLNRPSFPSTGQTALKDFHRADLATFAGSWEPDRDLTLELKMGMNQSESGLPVPVQNAYGAEGRALSHYQLLRATQRLGVDSEVECTISHSQLDMRLLELFGKNDAFRFDERQCEIEAILRTSNVRGRLHSVFGGLLRQNGVAAEDLFAEKRHNRLQRAFTHQAVRIADPLRATAAFSVEESTTGGLQEAWQVALAVLLPPSHTARVSYSIAPTVPSLGYKYMDFAVSENTRVIGNPDIVPQKLESVEVGVEGEYLNHTIAVGLNAYYMERERVPLAVAEVTSYFPAPQVDIQFQSIDRAVARGMEFLAEYRLGWFGKIYGNYTRERITSLIEENALAVSTPRNKINLGMLMSFGVGLSGGVNLGYKDTYIMDPSDVSKPRASIGAYTRLDARVAYRMSEKGELFVAGQNLLEESHIEYVDGLAHPRIYYAGMKFRLGR